MSQVCRDSPLRWKDGVGSGACGVGEVRLVWDVRCGECSVRCGVWGVWCGVGCLWVWGDIALQKCTLKYSRNAIF